MTYLEETGRKKRIECDVLPLSGVHSLRGKNVDSTDSALVEAALGGQSAAFAELVNRHQDSVFNLAYRMTNDWADAKDVAQEVFVKAYRKLGSYRANYAFRNWLLTICANTAKNRFRSVSRLRAAEQAHVELESMRHEERHGHENDERLENGLRRLDEKLRIPLVLKHVEGLSYDEVSSILKISVSAAKMRVKRGRDMLAELLRGGDHQA
jgi:RNA polymerase sigma factor (sigma-70 family)